MKMVEFEEKEIVPYDVVLRQVGYEKCLPSHRFGPHIRSHYLIHYIKKGCGIFRYEDCEIKLSKGELFLIYPEEVTYYNADENEPWEYYWFGFEGDSCNELLSAMGFSRQNRKVSYKLGAKFSIDESVMNLTNRKVINKSDRVYETAKLYEITSYLIKNNELGDIKSNKSKEEALFMAAVEYIKRSYMLHITIVDVAMHIGVDRTQVYRYFMKFVGISPQQYLIELRIKKAEDLLVDTSYKIKQIAYSVGYKDEYLFSKMFKIKNGLSPKKFRESQNG